MIFSRLVIFSLSLPIKEMAKEEKVTLSATLQIVPNWLFSQERIDYLVI